MNLNELPLKMKMNDLNIAIFNALGQKVVPVASGTYSGLNVIDVNTEKLNSGVYFLNITSQNGTSTKRFVVEK